MVGLQLLHELAGRDRPDGLLLLGDGQQAVYPGGFRLAEAGLSVAGRSVVLTTKYRNTVEILAAAGSVVGEDGFDDVDVTAATGDRGVEVVARRPADDRGVRGPAGARLGAAVGHPIAG